MLGSDHPSSGSAMPTTSNSEEKRNRRTGDTVTCAPAMSPPTRLPHGEQREGNASELGAAVIFGEGGKPDLGRAEPTPRHAERLMMVMTPRDSSAPRIDPACLSSGRQARTGGARAMSVVPIPPITAATPRARTGETAAVSSATSSGPTMNVISCSDASSA